MPSLFRTVLLIAFTFALFYFSQSDSSHTKKKPKRAATSAQTCVIDVKQLSCTAPNSVCPKGSCCGKSGLLFSL